MLGDAGFVSAVLQDYRAASLPAKDRALFAFLDRVNSDSPRIARHDLEALKSVGWGEEAIYDAITVCALFNFYNRWVDAAGVQEMPPEAYEMAGRRMAEHGYTPHPEESDRSGT